MCHTQAQPARCTSVQLAGRPFDEAGYRGSPSSCSGARRSPLPAAALPKATQPKAALPKAALPEARLPEARLP
ncbi:MAG: hypothetical protein QOI68_2606, partial [Pseudonocardiales bacterium]|nr:hypothetical protein [Pseudonocardiales bacterium]